MKDKNPNRCKCYPVDNSSAAGAGENMLPLRVKSEESTAWNLNLFIATVTRQDKRPHGILGQRVLRLFHATAVDIPLNKLITNTT